MSVFKWCARLSAVVLITLGLAACGQTGRLYLPKAKTVSHSSTQQTTAKQHAA